MLAPGAAGERGLQEKSGSTGARTCRNQAMTLRNPRMMAWGLYWGALYLVDLVYGGAEEGGWWYQAGTLDERT